MQQTSPSQPQTEAEPKGRVAVVDIGSNSVRLVVYDTPNRLPIPMFNEKAQCALGAGLGQTGKLNPKGVKAALRALRRFTNLIEVQGVDVIDQVATAAVREASDGPDFVLEVERLTGHPVRVLSGEEEAKLAAIGLLSGVPGADGVIGDLGGGSLDLVGLNGGGFGDFATLELGHIRLTERAKSDPDRAAKIVKKDLAEVACLDNVGGRTLYAAGGSWRAIARILIDQTQHPIHVIDNFRLPANEAERLLDLIGHAGHDQIEMIQGVPKKRADTLPFAAIALAGLLRRTGAAWLQFSGFGMREGVMLSHLSNDMSHQDPLISASKTMAERTGRFAVSGRETLEWMSPLFPDETAPEQRLRHAACLLADIGWNEHPDYRAEHAYLRVLRIPYAGLGHTDRAVLALATYVRNNGEPGDNLTRPVMGLLDEGQIAWARAVGLALRLAHTISGSAEGVLNHIPLRKSSAKLYLEVEAGGNLALISEAVERRFKTLARSLDLKPKIS